MTRVLAFVWILLFGFGGAAARAQGESGLLHGIDEVLGRGDRSPTIDEVLGDALGRLRGIDALSARALAERLRENEAELKLYETLLRHARAGMLVDVPRKTPPSAAPSPESVAEERRRVEALSRQLEEAEADLRGRKAMPKKTAEPKASGASDALLDVLVDVPPPPERNHVVIAADPANLSRALFEAGDFVGTLAALDQIGPETLTAEQKFRRARALDQLGRTKDARAAYEAVVASEKNGAFGRQAAWMLRLSRTREQVAGAIGTAESRPNGGRKP